MTQAWPMVKLSEVLHLQRRWIKLHPTDMYREIGIRSFGHGIFHKAPVQGSVLGNKRVLRIEPGDLVFNNVFAWEGAVAVAGPDEAGMIGSHRFVTYTVNPQKAMAEFLQLFFKTRDGREILLKASPGSAGRNKTLGLDRFITQSIPLPPVVEQKCLVARIEALTTKIEDAKACRAAVEHERGILFNQYLLALFKGLRERQTVRNTGAIEIVCGQHLSPEDQAEFGTPYMTGPADFTGKVAKPSRFACTFRAFCEPGDVLLTVKGAGVGKVNLAPPVRCAIGRQLFALRPQPDKILPAFLYFALMAGLRHFRVAMTATTVPGIGRSEVEGLEIPVPTLAEQHRIIALMESMESSLDNLSQLQSEVSEQINALLPAVLHREFKGELCPNTRSAQCQATSQPPSNTGTLRAP